MAKRQKTLKKPDFPIQNFKKPKKNKHFKEKSSIFVPTDRAL
ncbi:hypothetical protein [Hugenholtzia roseola]|nr:hypothetical protein [Hugenholtzia roseola]